MSEASVTTRLDWGLHLEAMNYICGERVRNKMQNVSYVDS